MHLDCLFFKIIDHSCKNNKNYKKIFSYLDDKKLIKFNIDAKVKKKNMEKKIFLNS